MEHAQGCLGLFQQFLMHDQRCGFYVQLIKKTLPFARRRLQQVMAQGSRGAEKTLADMKLLLRVKDRAGISCWAGLRSRAAGLKYGWQALLRVPSGLAQALWEVNFRNLLGNAL